MVVSAIPIDVANIATSVSACDPAGAYDILDLIMNHKSFVASSLSVYNPLDGTHDTLASIGYPKQVLSHLNGKLVTDDIIYQYYKSQGLRQKVWKWAQMPFDYRKTYSVQEVYLPAGFQDGITMCLYNRDGRYTGNLHISSDDSRFPTQNMIDEIQSVRKILGNFSDLLRSISVQIKDKFEGEGGCLLVPDGSFTRFPGKALLPSSLCEALKTRVGQCKYDKVPEVFLFKHEAAWFRVYSEVLKGGIRAISADECQVPYNLTARELEIITLMISGATNKEIASNIFVAPTTVSKHIENIFGKLNCNSRTSVVAVALVSNLRCLLQ